MPEVNPATRKHVSVREIMNSPIITGSEEETIEDIAQRMCDCKISSVIIMNGQKPIGIVTEQDIITKVVTKNKKPSKVLVKEIMSTPLYTIGGVKDVTEATKFMRKMEIKKLGVIDKEKLMGVVSVSDIVSVMPEIYAIVAEKARMRASQLMGRTSHLAGVCDSCDQWFDDLDRSEGKYLCYDCRIETAPESLHE